MKTRSPIFLIALSALVLALPLAGCGGRAVADAPGAPAGQDPARDGAAPAAEATTIRRAEADANGIVVAAAGPGTIAQALEAQGLLAVPEGRQAQATARYPGRILALRANVGDTVRAGQPLASIDSNLSLSAYTVTAPIAGVVLSRLAQVGGGAAEGQPLFDIAEVSTVRADLHLFGAQLRQVQAGNPVVLTRLYDGASMETTVAAVLPGTLAASQSAIARAMVDNRDGQWRPGMAVTARITTDRRQAALVVPLAALQTLDGAEAVFVRRGDTYTARTLRLGARDARVAQVLEGLAPGEEVVVEQSYLVKADIEKSGASHAH